MSLSPATFSAIPPIKEEPPGFVAHEKSDSPSPAYQQNTLLMSPLVPQTNKGLVPSLSPSAPTLYPLYKTVPHPLIIHGIEPSPPPSVPKREALKSKNPVSVPVAPVPVVSPLFKSPQKPPVVSPITPGSLAPSSHQIKAPDIMPPFSPSIAPVPIASAPSKFLNSPRIHPTMPKEPSSNSPEPGVAPVLTPSPTIDWKGDGMPVAAPPNETPNPFSLMNPSPTSAPSIDKALTSFNRTVPPLSSPNSPPNLRSHSPASLPPSSVYKHHHANDNITNLAPSSPLLPPPASSRQVLSPNPLPFPSPESNVSPVPSPSPTASSGQTRLPFLSPEIYPSGSSPLYPKTPISPPFQALPPPPPNKDCSSLTCMEPLTNTLPQSPCGCVLPMQVGLRLSVALYTFFPLVSELAEEIAVGVFVTKSQVRIMGANAASQDPEKTIVLIDLVPLGDKFDNTTAYLTFQRFWHKQVAIKISLFGNFEVLYVRYPGLPPSPPSSVTVIDGGPYSSHGNNGRNVQPLGVDVRRPHHKNGLNGSVVAVIILSASIAVILCCAVVWVFLFKRRNCPQEWPPPANLPSLSKPSGIAASIFGSGRSNTSLSFGSSFATFTGSAKTFGSIDIERATDNFNASRILGEGGFGLVYSGVLEDGTEVAVKVLKRDDQEGGREFLAEVEMLSRLHHRNLVKLIGICTEEHARCLVYELIPNGSVESHLHGIDKETTPLDWSARLKIALGAARGLAYLHEDSSPRVIHRDFKSSNILLEHDFTPKVSDFGLARTALDEENRHISTRVMGTFGSPKHSFYAKMEMPSGCLAGGTTYYSLLPLSHPTHVLNVLAAPRIGYVAPEYAMTGHLLVKSDVYSYGVVLLELLTGRKPVDMSQPPGRENLVTWARPLLTNKEGLESIIDPYLGLTSPFDSIAKVAAIASMCVQPEVANRPFMGEVVQALKLVCNESEGTRELGSRSSSQEDLSPSDMDARITGTISGQLPEDPSRIHSPISNYDSRLDVEKGLSMIDFFSTSATLQRQEFGSFRRHSSSGSLRTGRVKLLWQKMRRLSGGTVSEHGTVFRLWPGSH
ncbi:hypothetical protein U1Q18_018035 [Sarracenia purpurea var. burkii]